MKKITFFKMYCNLIVLVSQIILFTYTNNIHAQWNTNTNQNNPICTLAGYDQFDVSMAQDGNGGAIITWVDSRNGNWDIYAQRIDRDGNILWAENGIPICIAANFQSQPKVVFSNSRVYITWVDQRNGNYDIYAQMLFLDGNPQLTTNGIPICTSENMQNKPSIISDLNGGALICWTDRRNNTVNDDIYIQRLDFNGVPQWTSNGVPVCIDCIESFSTNKPQIITDGTAGGSIVAWSKFDGVSSDIYAQRINTSGAQNWDSNGVPICTANNVQTNPKIIQTNTGGAIIAWEDNRTNSGMDIYAQKVNATGNILWSSNGIAVCTSQYNQTALNIVSDNLGGAYLVWEDERSFNKDIYAQKIDSNGNSIWTSNGLPISTSNNQQSEPKLLLKYNGEVFFVWAENSDIYAQSTNVSGNLLWNTNGVMVSNASGNQYGIDLVSNNNNEVFIAWQDNRNGPFDIYASKLSNNGTLNLSSFETNNAIQVFPNPVKSLLSITNPLSQNISDITIVDITGKIYYKTNKILDTINVESLSNGIYFLKIEINDKLITVKFIKS
jgi:hypothetical protein